VRAHRGRPGPTVLLAGDGADLRDLRALLAILPVDAYGQVYVEVASAVQIERLEVPARVAVTWLERERETSSAVRGALLTTAVDAWIDEWMPAGVRNDGRIAWIGCAAAPRIATRYRTLQDRSMTAAGMGLPTVGPDGVE
jgi:NADPH-dependent ferric siderophore reductase